MRRRGTRSRSIHAAARSASHSSQPSRYCSPASRQHCHDPELVDSTTLLVAFGVTLALVGIIQKATLGDHAWGGMKIYGFWTPENLLTTPFGPYVNKNHFAGWMLMGLPLALGFALGLAERGTRHLSSGWRAVVLWFSSPEGGKLQMTLLAIFLMAASLLMTKSRSGVGGLAIAVITVSIVAGRRFGSARAGIAALVTLAILFVVVLGVADSEFANRVTSRMEAVELRKNIWSDSASVIRDFPLTGTGLNTFGTAMMVYQTVQHDQHFQEAHNDYLQVLVEGGLLVAIPAAAALFLIVRAIYRRFSAREDDTLTYWIRVGATTGLIAIAAQAFVEFSLQMPGNATMAVVLLAIALHRPPHRRQLPTPNSKLQTPNIKLPNCQSMIEREAWELGVGNWELNNLAQALSRRHAPKETFDSGALTESAIAHGVEALLWEALADSQWCSREASRRARAARSCRRHA